MTALLEKAIRCLSELPDEQQDALASIVLNELASEKKWGDLFGKSQDMLAQMSNEALRDFEEGKS